MNSPFTDFIEVASETFTATESDMEVKGPFTDELLEVEFTDQMINEDKSIALSNKYRIDTKKAIAANKYYETNLWGSNKANIYRYLFSYKIINIPQAMSDENFAYAVADFQALTRLTIDGKLGPATYAKLKLKPSAAPTPVTPLRSRWHSVIRDTIQCFAEPMVGGNETMKHMVTAIRTANAPGHYIYILGWMLDVDFCLIYNDPTTKLKSLLKEAVAKGAEVRALIWGNPTYIRTDEIARDTINSLTSTKGGTARMILDNNTFGSETVKNAIIRVKSIISKIPGSVKDLLSKIDAWNEMNAALDLVRNEGSHHEKVLIVKGSEGMIGFAGGIDINSNRVDALKGDCCGTDPKTGLPYLAAHICNVTVKLGHIHSDVLRDVNCRVRDEAAWKLLQQFIRRWESYKANPRFSFVPDPYLYIPLKGAKEPRPICPPSPSNSNIKVTHTFNNPTNPAVKDRSTWETLKIAIDNAKKKIYFEDQYMISCDIADRLNARLKDPLFENLTILIQSDQLSSELMFPNKMRSAFLRRLYNGIPQSVIDRKVFIKMLDPVMSVPLHRRMHSKIYIIDEDLAIIGSANCSNRSMVHDSETNLLFFNDDLSKKNFVSEFNGKLLAEVANKIKYDPEATKKSKDLSDKDIDERIIVGVRNWVANADRKTLLAMKLLNLDSLPQLIISTVKALRPFLLQVVEPYSNCGVFDVGADYELETLFTNEMIESKKQELATAFFEANQDEMFEHGPFVNENDYVSSESHNYLKKKKCNCKSENLISDEQTYMGENVFNEAGEAPWQNEKENFYEQAGYQSYTSEEEQIAEAIEREGSKITPPCEGRTCWAKSVLNNISGLRLAINNTLDEQTKNAISDFQLKNNLTQTRTIDAVTERALLEADAVQKQGSTAATIITEAKTRIEDWTSKGVSGVKTKPQHILNSFRDPRKLWAFVLHQMAFKRMGRVSRKYSDPESYINTGAHFCILFDGRIIQLHPLSRMIWHGNCVSPRSVAVEFEGNFPNVKGRWWIDSKSTVQNKDVPTQAQYDAGRFLTKYLKTVLRTTHILAHRQSSDSRENDPGPDVWYNVGQWGIENLSLTDGGSFKCGTGNPILPEWRTWGNKTSTQINKESGEVENEDFLNEYDETEELISAEEDESWEGEEEDLLESSEAIDQFEEMDEEQFDDEYDDRTAFEENQIELYDTEDETINEWDQEELNEEIEAYKGDAINEWDQLELDEVTEEYNDETIDELDREELDEVTNRLHDFEEPLMEIEEYVENDFPDIIEKFSPKAKNYLSILTALIANGTTDENELTNSILWLRHPELNNRKLKKNDLPALKKEWIKIRNDIVRPLLNRIKDNQDDYYKRIVEEQKKLADLQKAIVRLNGLKNYKDSVLVDELNGEPVIFEFEDGKLKYNLSYPNEKGRVYYQKGDIILLSSAPANNLPTYFTSSKDSYDSDEVIALLAVLLAFLSDGEQPEYLIAFRIEKINYVPMRSGISGRPYTTVDLMPLMKINDTWIEAKKINVKAYSFGKSLGDDDSLSSRFTHTRTWEKLDKLGDKLKIVAEISEKILSLWSGGMQRIILKKAVRWGAKKALGAGIKKVIKYYISRLVRGIPGVLFDGAKAFAKTLLSESLKQIVEKNNLRQFQAALRSKSFESILRKASTEMAKAMVDKLFELLIGDKVDLFFSDLLKRAGKTGGMERVKALITGFITEKIISLFSKDFLNELINIGSEAYEEYLQDKGDFGTLFSEKFNEKLSKDFIEKSKDWGRDAAVDLISEKVIKIFDK